MEFQPMSPEEIERTVQFLLHHQAAFAADFEKLSMRTALIADGLIGLTGIVGRVTERVGELAEAQQRTDQQIKELKTEMRTGFAELGDYIKTVESHLNVVIDMFERHRRDDHGH